MGKNMGLCLYLVSCEKPYHHSFRFLTFLILFVCRNTISTELNTLRFKEPRLYNPEGWGAQSSNFDPKTSSQYDLGSSLEIDLVNLPDSLIMTIENLIKKERPEIVFIDDDDDDEHFKLGELGPILLKILPCLCHYYSWFSIPSCSSLKAFFPKEEAETIDKVVVYLNT